MSNDWPFAALVLRGISRVSGQAILHMGHSERCVMKDSWCSPIHNGRTWLYGAAAREYRLRLAGGVDAVARRVAVKAAREALDEINSLARAVAAPKAKVVPLNRRRPKKAAA
ncbi:MAG: hypothetical protein QM805_10835 [Pseudomonas sp.]